MRLSATNTEPIEHGHTGMVSTAKQREKRNGYFFFYFITSISEISQRKAWPTRKTRKYKDEQTVVKNVPAAQGKKSIQSLH